jgi:hypothetical protein
MDRVGLAVGERVLLSAALKENFWCVGLVL